MGLADKAYEWLASGPTPGCERILGDALTRAEPAYVERLAECLLQRRTAAAWDGLISNFAALPEDMRARVISDADLMMAGITSAIRSEAAEARMNALEAYALIPTERLSHILPSVLRDESLPVRSRAAELLRAVADSVYTRREATWENPDADDHDARQSLRKLIDTLREVLGGIDIHRRVETVEVCLWFVEELGTDLWQAINKSRSRVAHVIEKRLREWDGPRIAPFLLRAAAHPAWRREALKRLGEWQSPDRLTALLRYTAVLGDPAVRRAMQGVKSPPWFSKVGWELLEVPEQLRSYAPNWVCSAGFSDRERTAYLTRWARAAGTKLGQAAARALGKLGQTDGQIEPGAGGGRPGRGGEFTGSYAGSAGHDQPNSAPPPSKRDPTSDSSRNTEFAMLWQLCRRTPPGANGELVALVLEHIGVWGHRLADCTRSPDPRDRILAMQIIRAGGQSKAFHFELEALERDKIAGIRKLAAAMLDTSVAAANKQAAQPSPPKPAAPTVEPTQEARDMLKTIIAELIKRDDIRAEESAMLLDELKLRLRQLYGQERSESAEQPTEGRVSA